MRSKNTTVNTFLRLMLTEKKKMYRHMHRLGSHGHHCRYSGIMSLEEEVKMLEKAKEHLEAQQANVDERLVKPKE